MNHLRGVSAGPWQGWGCSVTQGDRQQELYGRCWVWYCPSCLRNWWMSTNCALSEKIKIHCPTKQMTHGGVRGWKGFQALLHAQLPAGTFFLQLLQGHWSTESSFRVAFHSILHIKNNSPRPTNCSQDWQATICVKTKCMCFLNTVETKQRSLTCGAFQLSHRGWFAKLQ